MGALFGGGSPKPPAPPPPAPIPDLQDPALLASGKRRKLNDLMARGGRVSTDITGDYSSDKLGMR